jgi:signal peptidase II
LKKRQALFWAAMGGMFLVDQLVKLWARHSLGQGQALALPWPGVFEIELTTNRGIAFGYFQGQGPLLSPIAVVISLGSIWYVRRHPEESRWNHLAFGLLAAGALGNLFDRLVFGQVTDMFWFRLIKFPVFNVADSCITVATIMLILGWWVEGTRRKPERSETSSAEAKYGVVCAETDASD